jgi:anti-sigma factor RsiW
VVMADDHLLVGAYALDALDPAERRAFEAHLERCAACRTEVSELTGTAALLAVAVPAPVGEPLFDRVMDEVRTTPQLSPLLAVPGHGATAEAPRPRRRLPGNQPRWWLGAAAVIIFALVVGTTVTRLAREHARDADLAAIIDDPAGQHHELRGDRPGRVLVHLQPDTGRAAVEAHGVPALDPSKTYELWFMAGGTARRAVTFEPDGSGTVRIAFTPPVAEPDAFGVTIEPAGGSDVPTLPIVLQA